jgi:hypothetical protein
MKVHFIGKLIFKFSDILNIKRENCNSLFPVGILPYNVVLDLKLFFLFLN